MLGAYASSSFHNKRTLTGRSYEPDLKLDYGHTVAVKHYLHELQHHKLCVHTPAPAMRLAHLVA